MAMQFSPDEIEAMRDWGSLAPEYDNEVNFFGLPVEFSIPDIKHECGYADAEKKKKKAEQAKVRYHKMTAEQKRRKNQKRWKKTALETVPEEVEEYVQEEPHQTWIHTELTNAPQTSSECHDQWISELIKPETKQPSEEFTKVSKILSEMAPSGKRPSPYQRMSIEERQAVNKKKYNAKKVKENQKAAMTVDQLMGYGGGGANYFHPAPSYSLCPGSSAESYYPAPYPPAPYPPGPDAWKGASYGSNDFQLYQTATPTGPMTYYHTTTTIDTPTYHQLAQYPLWDDIENANCQRREEQVVKEAETPVENDDSTKTDQDIFLEFFYPPDKAL